MSDRPCGYLRYFLFVSVLGTPQWEAADAEIEVPSGENTELKRSPLKAWSRYIAIYATLTARDFFFAHFYPSGPFTFIFFLKHLPVSPVLAVANT